MAQESQCFPVGGGWVDSLFFSLNINSGALMHFLVYASKHMGRQLS